MRTIRFYGLILVLFLASGEMQAVRDQPAASIPKRDCWGSTKPKGQVCLVRFDELWTNASLFDGALIKLVGYAYSTSNSAHLFSTKESFIYSAGRGGVDILLGDTELEDFRQLATDDGAIAVIGRFHSGRGVVRGSLGTIDGEVLFFKESNRWELPDLPPPNRRDVRGHSGG